MTLVQARAPEISFPAGLDLSTIAEIALRVLGIDRGEAHRFAQSVDSADDLARPGAGERDLRETGRRQGNSAC